MRAVVTAIVGAALIFTLLAVSAVFSDWAWFAPAATVIILTLATGLIARSFDFIRYTGLAVLVEFVVAALVVLAVGAPNASFLGIIPTPGSVVELVRSVSRGFADVYDTAAPAQSTHGLTVLTVVAFALMTMLIDSLVQDLRVPKIAGGLLLVSWLVPVFIAPLSVQWWHVAALCVGFVLLLLTMIVGKRRGFVWALGAACLALLVGLVIPMLLPPIVPQANKAAGAGEDVKVVNPFLDMRADLNEQSDDVVLSYTSPDPLLPPIRLTSVSDFNGEEWAPAPFSFNRGQSPDTGLPHVQVPDQVVTNEYTDTFSVKGLGGNHLPAPFAPTRTTSVGDRWIYDTETLTIVGRGVTPAGLNYDVSYTSVEPTVEQLEDAPEADPAEFEDYLELPDNLPGDIRAEAERVTAGAENNWERAAMLQAYFRTFTYSLDAPNSASGNVISQFLKERKGYCVQFAGAMATMSRMLGIPARIGVGFTGGTPNADGGIDLTMQQSHAWPELYFEGVGWVRFEPTPGGPAGPPPPWSLEETSDSEPTAEPTEAPEDEPTDVPSTQAPEPSETAVAAQPELPAAGGGASGVNLWPVALVVVIVALVFTPALTRTVVRNRRLHTPLEPRKVWDEIRATAVDCGVSTPAAQTVKGQGMDLSDRIPERAQDIQALMGAVERERYAGTHESGLRFDAARLIRAVRNEYAPTWWARVKAWFLPRSLWKK